MSNYYTQFSEALVLKGAKQVKWVRNALATDYLREHHADTRYVHDAA